MSKDEIRKLCREARNKGGYTTAEMLLDIWNDDEDIPDKYLELFIHKVEPRDYIIYTSAYGAEMFEKMLDEHYKRLIDNSNE
mgnify:CR=1 FL=1